MPEQRTTTTVFLDLYPEDLCKLLANHVGLDVTDLKKFNFLSNSENGITIHASTDKPFVPKKDDK